MSAKTPACVTLACNGCGADLAGDGFVMHFADTHEALAAGDEQMWTGDAQSGDAWCPACQGPANDGEADAEPIDSCRPVTVEVDGELVTARVRGGEEMSEEGRAAFAQVVAAASRKLAADRAANPPDPADYPLDVVLDGDLVHKAKPMGAVGRRVTTLCGINARHVPGRDGGVRCPNCQELGAKP